MEELGLGRGGAPLVVAGPDVAEKVEHVLPRERQPAGQHVVKGDPTAPYLGFRDDSRVSELRYEVWYSG